jgi:hypothetical protein
MREDIGCRAFQRVAAFERSEQGRDFSPQLVVTSRCLGQKRITRRR